MNRILCSLLGHRWNRDLDLGYPSRFCVRCDLIEWAARSADRQWYPWG